MSYALELYALAMYFALQFFLNSAQFFLTKRLFKAYPWAVKFLDSLKRLKKEAHQIVINLLLSSLLFFSLLSSFHIFLWRKPCGQAAEIAVDDFEKEGGSNLAFGLWRDKISTSLYLLYVILDFFGPATR